MSKSLVGFLCFIGRELSAVTAPRNASVHLFKLILRGLQGHHQGHGDLKKAQESLEFEETTSTLGHVVAFCLLMASIEQMNNLPKSLSAAQALLSCTLP